MFEQLEMCRPGNYLSVTGSSGRELRPLQGENRGQISFFSSLFISFPLSGSFCVAPPPFSVYFLSLFLCTYKQRTESNLFFFFWVGGCLADVEETFSFFLPLFPSSVLFCLSPVVLILSCFQ